MFWYCRSWRLLVCNNSLASMLTTLRYTTVSVAVTLVPVHSGSATNHHAGYNFKSLQQISPYLEPSGSGISSLWARTTALKYNTNVVVGYPERVDVTPIWPTGPEYYNSAIIVNGDGETVANYRKSFLYSVDESWALEGKHGFFQGHVRGLGQTAMGICKDLD